MSISCVHISGVNVSGMSASCVRGVSGRGVSVSFVNLKFVVCSCEVLLPLFSRHDATRRNTRHDAR